MGVWAASHVDTKETRLLASGMTGWLLEGWVLFCRFINGGLGRDVGRLIPWQVLITAWPFGDTKWLFTLFEDWIDGNNGGSALLLGTRWLRERESLVETGSVTETGFSGEEFGCIWELRRPCWAGNK